MKWSIKKMTINSANRDKLEIENSSVDDSNTNMFQAPNVTHYYITTTAIGKEEQHQVITPEKASETVL